MPQDQAPSQAPHEPQPRAQSRSRKVPPLVYIIVALVAAWLIGTVVMRKGEHVTPSGGTMPQADEGTAYMPASPATDGAPAVKGHTIETNPQTSSSPTK